MTNNKKKKPILTKGLDEIFGGNVQQVINNIKKERTNGQATEILISKLVPNPYQPRKQFDQKEIEGLANSIRQNGLFTPILVKENEIGDYYIVAGERRTKASKLVGLEKIPAIIADISDVEMQRITLVENIQREDLNPIEVALSLKEIINTQKINQEQVGKIIGKSRSYVANLLNLLKLDQKIINGVLSGKVSYGHVRPLVTLTGEDAINIYKKILNQDLSVREVEGYAKAAKLREARANKQTIKSKNIKSQEIIYAEELLRNKIKSKVEITSNEIKIKYKGKDQLSRILERIDAVEK